MVRINVVSKNDITKSFGKIFMISFFLFVLISKVNLKDIKISSTIKKDNRKINKLFRYFFQLTKFFLRN